MNNYTVSSQETCSQLLCVVESGEWREVYLRTYDTHFEVIEHSCGAETWSVYGVSSRYQLLTIWNLALVDPVRTFFSEDSPSLQELIVLLEACGIPFGHLELLEGEDVTYRMYHGLARGRT